MTHSQVAASIRRSKELHPEIFCKFPKCLWRCSQWLGDDPYCPNHRPKLTATTDLPPNQVVTGGATHLTPSESSTEGVGGCDDFVMPTLGTTVILDEHVIPILNGAKSPVGIVNQYICAWFTYPERILITAVRWSDA